MMYTQRPASSARPLNKPVPINQRSQTPAPFVQRKSAVQPGQTYIPPGTYTQGNTKLNVHYAAPPTTQKGRTIRDTEEPQAVPRRKRHLHPLLYLGIGMLAMLALWVALTSLVSWVELKLDDFTYGYPRTY